MIGDNSGITIGVVLAIIAGLFALWWRIESKFFVEQTARQEMVTREQEARHHIERDLNVFKTYVAQNHVSTVALKEAEERMVLTFQRLYDRIETLVARLDRLAQNMVARDRSSDGGN